MYVIINIGGTGNQLFQYAFAKELSKHTKRRILLSSTVTFGRDSLGRIAILPHLNSALEFTTGLRRNAYNLQYRLHKAFKWLRFPDTTIQYEEALTESGGAARWGADGFVKLDEMFAAQTVLLVGYWQHASIVNANRDDLLNELAYPPGLSAAHQQQVAAVKQYEQAAALHLRFDYKGYTELDRAYYEWAIKLLRDKRRDNGDGENARQHFFVFADNNSKATEFLAPLLRQEEYSIMPNSGYQSALADYQSMLVMAECRDFIMSQSTFCWWAAWMNWARSSAGRQNYIMPRSFKQHLNFSLQHCIFPDAKD